jgi:hypothetical protein
MLKFIRNLCIALVPIVPLYFLGKFILANDVQVSGFMGYFYLVLVLFISPLSYLFYKTKVLKKFANHITAYRRPI